VLTATVRETKIGIIKSKERKTMQGYNRVILAGNLTRDVETRTSPGGVSVAKFGLAVNRKYTVNGEQKEDVTFVDCTAFKATADVAGKYLAKGNPVLIEGRLKLETWKANDGTNRSKLVVNVDALTLLGAPNAQPATRESGPPPIKRREEESNHVSVEDDDDLPF